MPNADKYSWYLLTTDANSTTVKREFDDLSLKNAFEGKGVVEYFMPACFMRVRRSGSSEPVTRKTLFNYIFVHSTQRDIADIKSNVSRLNLKTPGNSPTGPRSALTVDDRQITMIRKIADIFGGKLPCYRNDEYDLSTCDTAHINGGPFEGIEGPLMCKTNRLSGQIMLSVRDLFIVATGEIQPQYINVIRLGERSRHPLQALETYIPRVTKALTHKLMTGQLDDDERNNIDAFTRRYALLRPDTDDDATLHTGLMLMSYTALSDNDAATQWLHAAQRLRPSLAPPQTALLDAMTYAATGHPTPSTPIDSQPTPSTKTEKTTQNLNAHFTTLYTSLKWLKT